MSLATLYNLPTSPQNLAEFSFANMNEHQKIAAAVEQLLGVRLDLFPLDPIPISDLPGWAYNHQQLHNDMDTLLGISGNDLTDIDFTKPEEVAIWSFLHASEHVLAAQILGLR